MVGSKVKVYILSKKDIFEINIFGIVRSKVVRNVFCNGRVRMCFDVIV